jgi:hypothetical protein
MTLRTQWQVPPSALVEEPPSALEESPSTLVEEPPSTLVEEAPSATVEESFSGAPLVLALWATRQLQPLTLLEEVLIGLE